jgi:hypothetical protein
LIGCVITQREVFMTGNLSQDWIVFLLLGAVAYFFVYVIIHSHMIKAKAKKESQTSDKINK